ncbi:MAG: alpha/beta fold hydrolase [Novosphingobium sp.]|nr:alpha/beta fold hydrolase [Novosphingobium sp.]
MRLRSLLAATGALLLALPAGTPVLAERPVADFARMPGIESPGLSPNGKLVVVTASIGGEQALVIIKADGGGIVARLPVGDADLLGVRWVNDEWLIATVGTEVAAMGGPAKATRLLAFRVDGSDAHFLLDKRNGNVGFNMSDVLWVARDGTPKILLSYQTSYYRDKEGFWPQVAFVDVATNAFSKVVWPREGVLDWYADAAGNVRLGIGIEREGLRTRALYRESNKDNFTEFGNARYDEELIVPFALMADGSAITMSARDGFRAVYALDLKTMQLGEKLFSVPGHDIESLYLSQGNESVRGYGYTDKAWRTVWVDPSRKALQAKLDASFPGKSVTILKTSTDDRVVLFKVGSAAAPGAYYTYEEGQPLTQLALENAAIGTRAQNPVKTVGYTARDGMSLNGVLTLPAGAEPRNLPVIIMPHGGPAAFDAEGWDWWSQFLADRGYAVFQPNFRGSTGFGKAYQSAGAGEWGMKMQDDVDDALAFLGKEGIGDVKRACVVGASYGGYVAMRAAERNPDFYRCAVSYAGVSDLPEMIKYNKNFIGGLGTADYWRNRAEDLSDVSPINHVDRNGIPILVVHGKKDRRVPFAQSQSYADRLKKAARRISSTFSPKETTSSAARRID